MLSKWKDVLLAPVAAFLVLSVPSCAAAVKIGDARAWDMGAEGGEWFWAIWLETAALGSLVILLIQDRRVLRHRSKRWI